MADRENPSPSARRCPICRKPVQDKAETFPFCSQRCRLMDLAKWRDERYVISRPIAQSDLEEGE